MTTEDALFDRIIKNVVQITKFHTKPYFWVISESENIWTSKFMKVTLISATYSLIISDKLPNI